MRCNRCSFGCRRGFFVIGIGRIPGNLCSMISERNQCDCCDRCCDECDDDRGNDCGCEYNSKNRSFGC